MPEFEQVGRRAKGRPVRVRVRPIMFCMTLAFLYKLSLHFYSRSSAIPILVCMSVRSSDKMC
jgi:hypothetical protein